MGCLSSDSARAGCTGAVPWPNTLTGPTNWSEKRPSNFLIYLHFLTVRQCRHTLIRTGKIKCNNNYYKVTKIYLEQNLIYSKRDRLFRILYSTINVT